MAIAPGKIIRFVPEEIKVKEIGCKRHRFPKSYTGRKVGVGTTYLCYKCGVTYKYKERSEQVTHDGNSHGGIIEVKKYWEVIQDKFDRKEVGEVVAEETERGIFSLDTEIRSI